jgi:hypothetical protein
LLPTNLRRAGETTTNHHERERHTLKGRGRQLPTSNRATRHTPSRRDDDKSSRTSTKRKGRQLPASTRATRHTHHCAFMLQCTTRGARCHPTILV